MSFDLVAFEAGIAPRSNDELEEWYGELLEQEVVSHDRADPQTLSPGLRGFYEEMRGTFPAMNGPDADPAAETDRLVDYECHPAMVYMTFRWSQVDLAMKLGRKLARKHRVGLLNPQGESYFVFRPGGVLGHLKRMFG